MEKGGVPNGGPRKSPTFTEFQLNRVAQHTDTLVAQRTRNSANSVLHYADTMLPRLTWISLILFKSVSSNSDPRSVSITESISCQFK